MVFCIKKRSKKHFSHYFIDSLYNINCEFFVIWLIIKNCIKYLFSDNLNCNIKIKVIFYSIKKICTTTWCNKLFTNLSIFDQDETKIHVLPEILVECVEENQYENDTNQFMYIYLIYKIIALLIQYSNYLVTHYFNFLYWIWY